MSTQRPPPRVDGATGRLAVSAPLQNHQSSQESNASSIISSVPSLLKSNSNVSQFTTTTTTEPPSPARPRADARNHAGNTTPSPKLYDKDGFVKPLRPFTPSRQLEANYDQTPPAGSPTPSPLSTTSPFQGIKRTASGAIKQSPGDANGRRSHSRNESLDSNGTRISEVCSPRLRDLHSPANQRTQALRSA